MKGHLNLRKSIYFFDLKNSQNEMKSYKSTLLYEIYKHINKGNSD